MRSKIMADRPTDEQLLNFLNIMKRRARDYLSATGRNDDTIVIGEYSRASVEYWDDLVVARFQELMPKRSTKCKGEGICPKCGADSYAKGKWCRWCRIYGLLEQNKEPDNG
jgi:ribosomal protein L40E